MIELERQAPGTWRNYHRTQERADATRFAFRGLPDGQPLIDQLRRTATLLGNLISEALASGGRVVPLGSAWSFSDLVRPDGWLLETGGLAIGPAPSSEGIADHLVLMSAGTRIRELNRYLEPVLSLETSGAHDGQTIGGALGTGTHGSALGRGAIQNQVRGLHIVTAPGRSVWLERGPAPLLDPAVAAVLADEAIVDPAAFDAALVHLGGMGLVNAVMIGARAGFSVDLVRRERALDAAAIDLLQAGRFADFAEPSWPTGGEMPYYAEVILDPYRPWAERSPGVPRPALITLLYERPPLATAPAMAAPEPMPAIDALNLLARGLEGPQAAAIELLPPAWIVPEIVALQFRQEPKGGAAPRRLTWGQANGAHEPLPLGLQLYNAAFALPRERLREALDIMLDAFLLDGGGHVVFTLRFVSHAAGALAFTRFAETVVVNMDGLRTGASREAGRRVALALETGGVPYSQHWAKMGAITPTRFRRDFGDPADPATPAGRWRAMRHRLLTPEVRAVVGSQSLAAWGVA